MACYAVIDTNVLVAALLSKHSDAATVQVLERVFDGQLVPLFEEGILAEYQDVLSRPKFRFPASQVQALLNAIVLSGLPVSRISTGAELPDPKDLVFYEAALARDGAYLVTGNQKHSPAEPFVVTPKAMLEVLDGLYK